MIYGYARARSPSQRIDAQLTLLRDAGATTLVYEITGAPWDERPELGNLIAGLVPGDAVLVTTLGHLTRSTSDLLRIAAALSDKSAGFRSLAEPWADTTTKEGVRLLAAMLAFSEQAHANSPEREFPETEPAE